MVKIDKEKCIGCGTCVSICDEEVFELGNDNKVHIKKDVDLKKNTKCIDEAIEACPVDAISK